MSVSNKKVDAKPLHVLASEAEEKGIIAETNMLILFVNFSAP
jgi:hypothetical protein